MHPSSCQSLPTSAPQAGESPHSTAIADGRPHTILEATYEADHRAIASYLLRRTGDRAVAADLASETFVEALRSLHRWSPQGLPLRAWLFRIATRRLTHHLRRARRSRHFILRLLPSAHQASATSPREARSEADHVRLALSRLRAHHQDVVVLHHVEGMSIDEISLTLDIPVGTVKSRLDRAREALHRHLSDLGAAS